MKLLLYASVFLLAGCVVAPTSGSVSIKPVPEVQITYHWDNYRSRYYRIERGTRFYMPPGWHDHKHPHGGPPGQRKKHKHKDRD